jgi:hypothetical protein
VEQTELDSAMYWTCIMQTQPTHTLPAWIQLCQSESATLTGERHSQPALEGMNHIVQNSLWADCTPPPLRPSKLNAIDGEYVIHLCLAWWSVMPGQTLRVGEGRITELNLGTMDGGNAEFPYLIGGRAELPEPKQL